MEILTIEEVIEHCNKTCDMTEKIANARGHKLQSIESKQFWEHYQVRAWLKELKQYKDLEERLNGVSVKQVVDGFIKTVENQTNEEYKHGRILTNAEADKWNEYKQLEEQGLLLRLPCKVGDTVYEIHPLTGKIAQRKIKSIVVCNCPDLTIMYKSGYDYSNVHDDFGKTVFLTKEEAEQKLKEMDGD